MYSLVTRYSLKTLVFCLLCTMALPAQAASLSELTAKLQALQASLQNYQATLLGRVPVTHLTAATTITVANDQQLFTALTTVTGGEIIKLQPGSYSAITLDPGFWKLRVGTLIKTDFATNLSSLTAPVTITSADLTRRAVLQSIQITNGAKNFRIENLSFRPTTGATVASLIGSDITFTRNDISFGDSTNWTAADWNAKVGNGIEANGTNIDISYNYLKNVNFGINGGTGSHVHHNKVENFIGDGLRGWDNSTFDNNIVMNPFQVNDNHIDGFQSFAAADESSSVKNVTLRNNTIFAEPSTNPLRSGMQGIALFDAFYDNWIIENNLVLVDHGHGITVMGGRTVTIQNNVAITPTNVAANSITWITVYPSKLGTPSTGITYKNNYANAVMNTIDGNTKVPFSDYSKYFVNTAAGDFTFKSTAVPFPVGAVIDMNLLAPEPYAAGGGTTVVTPIPTLTLTVNATNVTTGGAATLTWSTTNATSCTASGNWSGTKAVSGSESTGILGTAGTKNYSLACTGAGGTVTKTVSVTVTDAVVVPVSTTTFKIGDRISVTKNVNVRTTGLIDASTLIGVNPMGSQGVLVAGPTVSSDQYGVITWFNVNFDTGYDGWVGADNYALVPPVTTVTLPSITLSASPASVVVGNSSVITWSSANATACGASGDWSGTKAVSGSEATSLLSTVGTTTYTLECTGTGGAVSKSVTVRAVTSTTIATATTTTRVTVNSNVNVRATPNGTKLGTQLVGATGTLGTQLSVSTAGHIWVYVDFDSGVDGWVAKRYLTLTEPLVSATSMTTIDVQVNIASLLQQLVTLQQLLAQLPIK